MSKNEVANLGILIVEKGGSIKDTLVKEYKENELFKKCGFKKKTAL